MSHREHCACAYVQSMRLCIRRCRQPLCWAVQEFEQGSDAAATTPLWGANPVLSWGISEMP